MAKQAKRRRPVRVAQSHHRPGQSAAQLEGVRWRKSRFSGEGECVIVAEAGGEVALRNSNEPDGLALVFGRGELATWVAGCKAGEFDDLGEVTA